MFECHAFGGEKAAVCVDVMRKVFFVSRDEVECGGEDVERECEVFAECGEKGGDALVAERFQFLFFDGGFKK